MNPHIIEQDESEESSASGCDLVAGTSSEEGREEAAETSLARGDVVMTTETLGGSGDEKLVLSRAEGTGVALGAEEARREKTRKASATGDHIKEQPIEFLQGRFRISQTVPSRAQRIHLNSDSADLAVAGWRGDEQADELSISSPCRAAEIVQSFHLRSLARIETAIEELACDFSDVNKLEEKH